MQSSWGGAAEQPITDHLLVAVVCARAQGCPNRSLCAHASRSYGGNLGHTIQLCACAHVIYSLKRTFANHFPFSFFLMISGWRFGNYRLDRWHITIVERWHGRMHHRHRVRGRVHFCIDLLFLCFVHALNLLCCLCFAMISRFRDHEDEVLDVCFNCTGSMFCTASSDATARLYHTQTAHCTAVFQGHEGEISKVVFNPPGTARNMRGAVCASAPICRLHSLAGDRAHARLGVRLFM